MKDKTERRSERAFAKNVLYGIRKALGLITKGDF